MKLSLDRVIGNSLTEERIFPGMGIQSWLTGKNSVAPQNIRL